MKAMTKRSLWVDRKAYAYLRNAKRAARGMAPMTEESERKFWNLAIKRGDGKTELIDGFFLNLEVEDIKRMLESAGYDYEVDTVEMMDI